MINLNFGRLKVIGRQYDKDGNLRQWWNNATIRAFQKRAECFTKQYSATKLQPFDLYVNPINRLRQPQRNVKFASTFLPLRSMESTLRQRTLQITEDSRSHSG